LPAPRGALSLRLVPRRESGLATLACSRVHVRRTLVGVRRMVMSRGGSPGLEVSAVGKALPRRSRAAARRASEGTNGARASEWLELAEGTMREALAERLAQAHLTETQPD
jgi:hypothetical protein